MNGDNGDENNRIHKKIRDLSPEAVELLYKMGLKDDRPNPAEEFLYNLSLRRDFQRDLQLNRLVLDIPQMGFTKEEERQKWFKSQKGLEGLNYLSVTQLIAEKYKIPLDYQIGLDSYIFFGDDRILQMTNQWGLAQILPPAHTLEADDVDLERSYQEEKEPYAKIIVPGNSSKEEILKYIRKNWNKVEEILKKQGWTPKKRIRRTIYKERKVDQGTLARAYKRTSIGS